MITAVPNVRMTSASRSTSPGSSVAPRDRIRQGGALDPSADRAVGGVAVDVGGARRRSRLPHHGQMQPVGLLRIVDDVVDARRAGGWRAPTGRRRRDRSRRAATAAATRRSPRTARSPAPRRRGGPRRGPRGHGQPARGRTPSPSAASDRGRDRPRGRSSSSPCTASRLRASAGQQPERGRLQHDAEREPQRDPRGAAVAGARRDAGNRERDQQPAERTRRRTPAPRRSSRHAQPRGVPRQVQRGDGDGRQRRPASASTRARPHRQPGARSQIASRDGHHQRPDPDRPDQEDRRAHQSDERHPARVREPATSASAPTSPPRRTAPTPPARRSPPAGTHRDCRRRGANSTRPTAATASVDAAGTPASRS